MEEQFITIKFRNQELRVSVTRKTKSQKWLVCLHGIQSNKELFKDLIQQPFFKDYSVLAIDFIGFGRSDKPKDFSYDLQDQANIVEQIIKEMDIKEIYLIGHSLGGLLPMNMTNCIKNLGKRLKKPIADHLTYRKQRIIII
jgi:pimeloyl-ACP methyl ester carboxylesterase